LEKRDWLYEHHFCNIQNLKNRLMITLLLLAIFLPLVAGLGLSLSSKAAKHYGGWISSIVTLSSFCLLVLLFFNQERGEAITLGIPWVPSLGVNLNFLVDGLSLFFGFLVTGVGTLVCLYSQFYMDKQDDQINRFYAYLNLFTTAMLGTVFSDNLLVLFLFWELTGIASFLLIGYHYQDFQARISSRMVFLLISLTSLFLLMGILALASLNHTFVWSEIVSKGVDFSIHPFWQSGMILCFMIAIFGKSAQIPFHFWLPNAMCAPAPISAYLHAATMVKLGVFLTARMYPLFVASSLWFPLLETVCLATMVLGAVLSLLSNDLKQILAYATVSQLGFFISVYGMGDVGGVSYDFIHILNHAFYKGSLFMLVGIIYHATGIQDIRKLGGLMKDLPITAFIFFIATLAMASVPGTTGFISKEVIIHDLLLMEKDAAKGIVILVLILFASVFKVAFSIRLFYHLFVREEPKGEIEVHKPSFGCLISPAILSFGSLIFGIFPSGLEHIAGSFYVSGLHKESVSALKVWQGWSFGFGLSMTVLALGILLFYLAQKWRIWSEKHPFLDFARGWNTLMDNCVLKAGMLSSWLEGESFQRHLYTPFVLFSLSFISIIALNLNVIKPSSIVSFDLLQIVPLMMIIVTTASVLWIKELFSQILALAASGFFVTLYFIFYRGPDLAMTQILVEVVTGVMLVVMAWTNGTNGSQPNQKRVFSLFRFITSSLVAISAATAALLFSNQKLDQSLSQFFLSSSLPLAKGANVVNTILVDFRGLDTFGEVTVLFIALLGILGLITTENSSKKIYLIPSLIFQAMTPLLFLIVQIFSLWLLIRGHHHPGGGFIAGLASAIGLILLGYSRQFCDLKRWLFVPLNVLGATGLILILITGLIPSLFGYAFLTSGIFLIPSTLVFDFGVYLVVIAVTLTAVFTLRQDAFGGEY
jgi:NADH:ubiquinone oxidoreductase subunit 5 (subunit L)/multisubunit Na+/H+ antiporter MnhA subunit/multisubunit Na+/H+ antiporter MnhB subunit